MQTVKRPSEDLVKSAPKKEKKKGRKLSPDLYGVQTRIDSNSGDVATSTCEFTPAIFLCTLRIITRPIYPAKKLSLLEKMEALIS